MNTQSAPTAPRPLSQHALPSAKRLHSSPDRQSVRDSQTSAQKRKKSPHSDSGQMWPRGQSLSFSHTSDSHSPSSQTERRGQDDVSAHPEVEPTVTMPV